MKKVILILILISLFLSAWAQCPPSGNYFADTQLDIDNFATNYPNCTELPGHLFIGNSNFVNDYLSYITNLDGLSGLTSVGGELNIEKNGELTNLTGLENLTHIGRILYIYKNPNLVSLAGLENLSLIGATLRIQFNESLSDISALSSLTAVNTSSLFSGGLDIADNNNLTNLVGLENITSIDALSIRGNANLTTLSELENITGDLTGGISIRGNQNLTSIESLSGITSVGRDLEVASNDALVSLEGLENISTVGEDLYIRFNDALTDLTGLEEIINVEANMSIMENINLTTLSGLDNLQSIGEFLIIDYNDNLNTLAGLGNLESVGEYVQIRHNDNLISLSGLENLANIGEQLFVSSNPGLATLTGLESLENIGTHLLIANNASLTSLTGLENISVVEGNLAVQNHPNLTSLIDLDHILSVGGSLSIRDNSSLSSCNILTVCNYIQNGGTATINNNAPGCNTQAEVEAACTSASQCPPGDVTIASQAEMNAFATTYPNCTEINGNFIFTDPGPYNDIIINVPDLPALERITGTLSIGTYTILSANSFTALNHIDGSVHLSAGIDGELQALEHIGGSIIVFDGLNNGAGSMGVYPVLKYIGGSISAGGAEGGYLASSSFPLLERIEGGISGCGWGPTHDFSGFDNLRYIGGSIRTQQGTIAGMNMVDTIGGSIIFDDCYSTGIWVNITGLNQLKYIGGDLKFDAEHCLQDLSGLIQLNTVGGDFGITFQTNFACSTSMTDVVGLEQLQYVGDDLSLFESNLTNLDFLGQLVSVGDSLYIRANSFDNLDALNHPVGVGGELIISQNWNLSNCAVQAVCDHINANGTTVISGNTPGCNSQAEVEAACMPVVVCPDYFEPFSQQEIDDFPSNYPNCTTIGSLDLTFVFDITDLDSLVQLTTITEDVFMGLYGPININDISGLQNVTSIGGILVIDGTQLTDLSGLQSLTSASVLQISNNPNLTTLSGLENLDAATLANASIGNNDNLSICNLTNICTYLADGGTVDFNSNALGCDTQAQVETTCSPVTVCPDSFVSPSQQDIDDFPVNYPGCIEIPGNVYIAMDLVDNLDGLSQVAAVGGNLTIDTFVPNADFTVDISGLQNITTVGGNLKIQTDNYWTNPSLDALESLTSVGGDLEIGNNGFTDLSPLENLTSIGGTLSISGEYLTSLNGLENIDYTTITDLQIDNNGNLSYCHLPNICEYIENGGTTNISGNATGCATQNQVESRCISETACLDIFSASSQQEIDDFPSNYPNCTAVGHLDLHFPGDITNLDSLIQLTSVTDYVEIGFFEPNNIADISGLKNIASIGSYLQITGTQLTDLSGFQNLTSIGDYLWIYFNPNLLSLSGLENLDPATIGSLDISANDNLSVCSLSNICTYLSEGLGSYTSVTDNSPGCNSEIEVQADCSPTPPDNPCGGTTSSTDSLTHIFDEDLFIDGVGFANNPSITFPAPNANTTLSDISLELYFRLNGSSCENEIAIQITDPAGNTQPLTAYTSCDGGTGLFYVNLDVPSGSTTSSVADWIVEFDDTNDQNSDYEYSVRFARLNYVATTGGGSGETIVNEVSDFADSDLFIDGVGFENNGTYTFADPGTPADAVLSDISLELYFRLNGNSCENEIALQLTDPAGNTQALTAYTTCDGGTGLFYVNLDVPSGNTTGSAADWLLQFDDTNDQNTDYEYSVRFGRLTYTTTHTEGGGSTPVIITDEVVRTADSDLFIDGVGFDNNPTYTFYDPATPEIATLSDIQLELYFRLNGSSCENEIAIQLTDPAGNTQSLTAYTTCGGGTGLYYVNLNVPSGSVTGEIAPWIVQFDDTNDQNSDYEYSVRFGRLTYTTQYDLCETQMMIVEENNEEQQLHNSSTQQLVTPSTRQLNNSLKLYPVPASQHLNVEYFSENTNPMNIQIISNEGKTLISSQEFSQEGINTIQLNIADLPAGHYHIRMYNADDMQMQSFVKIAP